jgi:maltose alpha-D-glucosyltransferase/alpha-amylase
MGRSLDLASLLGRRTGELHVALAADNEHPAFAPEGISALDQRSLYQAIRTAVRRGLDSAKRRAPALPTEQADAVIELASREAEILQRVRSMASPRIQSDRIRVHGDYHLGQVLWTGRDSVIIDFEGEPARPLGERRLKRSPLRDVAGMLRSYHYATHQALHELSERGVLGEQGAATDTLQPWLDYWYRWSAVAFLRGYREVTGDTSLVPANDERAGALLEALLIEKAVYELTYEMNNRPDWLSIPIAGIESILEHTQS